jgi:plasmid maintenance system killer protein
MTARFEATPMSKAAAKKRNRRAPEELVAALQAKIEAIKARAERKRAKANPAVRFTVAAVRSMNKAMAAAEDNVLRKSLEEALSGLNAYLSLQGIVTAGGSNSASSGRRSSVDVEQMGNSLLAHVKSNPGQRGEQIAVTLGTDTKSLRRPMQKLIDEGTVKTKGQRRGMRYYPA